ncbi:hypothetical protein GOODEAATRI_003293 [Goodea atripinnis]|uniref:Uncharacterized protein n=1 Tax=Goodea atripinnis TaxID=208336 RepID=A0ABV0PUW5_9TELE
MGGDFQFDPRLKRHHIFTAAATVCCTQCLKARKNLLGLHQKDSNVINTELYCSGKHFSLLPQSLAYFAKLDLSFIDGESGVPCLRFAVFSSIGVSELCREKISEEDIYWFRVCVV